MYLDSMFGLKGKVALVTGGGRGIGQTVALGLAKAGARVFIVSRTGARAAAGVGREVAVVGFAVGAPGPATDAAGGAACGWPKTGAGCTGAGAAGAPSTLPGTRMPRVWPPACGRSRSISCSAAGSDCA